MEDSGGFLSSLQGRRSRRGAPLAPPPPSAGARSRDRRPAGRGGEQEGRLRLPDVRPVHPARDRDDLPDGLPEDPAQRPVRRRAHERPLRGGARDDVRLGQGRASHGPLRSEEHTSELQSLAYLVCRLLLEKKKKEIKLI